MILLELGVFKRGPDLLDLFWSSTLNGGEKNTSKFDLLVVKVSTSCQAVMLWTHLNNKKKSAEDFSPLIHCSKVTARCLLLLGVSVDMPVTQKDTLKSRQRQYFIVRPLWEKNRVQLVSSQTFKI